MTDRLRGCEARAWTTLTRTLLLVLVCAAAIGCGAGDDSVSTLPPPAKDAGGGDATTPTPDGGSKAAGGMDAGAGDDASGAPDAGGASAMFSQAAIGFGAVNCSASASKTLPITNSGKETLTVSASTVGSAFSVSPTALSLPTGGSGMLTLTATVPGSATAGTSLQGSLNLFTNDSAHSSVPIALSATPTGATIVDPTLDTAPVVGFPSSEVNTPSSPQQLTLKNIGNGPATVTFGVPTDPQFTLESADTGPLTALAGGSVLAAFDFTPTKTAKTTTTSSVTVSGAVCGTSVTSVSLNGQGAVGSITGYPSSTLNFGPVACGGTAPIPQTITLTNTGTVDALVTTSSVAGTGFTTSASVGQGIPANGGTLVVAFTAPAVSSTADPTKPITAQVTLQTDADPSPQTITLSETPSGAILAFDTTDAPATPGFGSFGATGLLQSVSQTFVVKNTGNQAANVALVATSSAGVAGAGAPATFSVSTPSFSVAGPGTQTDSATYAATATGTQAGTLSMQVTGGTTLCAPLPAALPLTGSGMGGVPAITQSSLAFTPACGGGAPPAQTFTIGNSGTSDMVWSMGAVTGPGATTYSVSSNPPPGTLHPDASASITVTAAAVPSPAVDPSPTAYAAQIAITTDVPFDVPHVVSLSETPLGDQLSFSTGSLRFGQFPVDTTSLGETFTVSNAANAGSPAANLGLSVSAVNQVSANAYAVTPASITNLAPGGGVSNPISVTFDPTTPATYPATLGISTTDSLCTALPSAIGLIGTGTEAKVTVSATTLAFGSDPSDPKGLVNCGATGLPQTLTISNSGNQSFQITALSLGLGASSPYALSGPGDTLPATIPIHGSTSITLTPNAIQSTVANPNDPSPYSDTLTITTSAASDSPHHVALVMQARGAIIADTPVATTWNFGTVGGGSIGTFANTITNTGNAAVSIALTGLKQPSIFGLQANPTTAGAGAVTAVIGQFTPPSANGQWSDQGTLVVTPTQALCEALPAAWTNAAVTMSGASNASPPVTVAGSLTFPSSDCGSGAPAGQAITLTNQTNQSFAFSTAFSSGAFYQATVASDAGSAVLPGGGSAMVVVTPRTVTPGPGVSAGSAPYVDDLTITVQSSPATTFTIPVSWTLNGAVLALPDALGPNRDAMGNAFYAADTTSGFELPMVNTGTATASVSFGIQAAGAFTFSPAGAIAVQPGITALPRLSASASDAACPALTAGSVTFLYSGPVCQPFPVSGVSIDSCVGTF